MGPIFSPSGSTAPARCSGRPRGCDFHRGEYPIFPRIVPDGAGGAIVTWTDRRSGTNDLYTQRVNSGGTVQWTANGVAVSTADGDQSSGTATSPPQILPDGFGGAIIVWQDHRSGQWDIYAQGISAGGRL